MPNDWIDEAGLLKVLEELAPSIVPNSPKGRVGVNEGLHFTGGEPFLNYSLLKRAVRLAEGLGYPSVFVETNCFWCLSEEIAIEKFNELRETGLEGVLLSVNPFLIEKIPLERVENGIGAAVEVFNPQNVLVYHTLYLTLLRKLSVRGTLRFEEYLEKAARVDPYLFLRGFDPGLLLPMGRLVYTLRKLYKTKPAKEFFKTSCAEELTRPWHVHVDCYYNYIPGYCAGLSLGDARKLKELLQGVNLDDKPVLAALRNSLGDLYKLAVGGYGYKERGEGYISRCHFCLDIRLHLALEVGGFTELQPSCFYKSILETTVKGVME